MLLRVPLALLLVAASAASAAAQDPAGEQDLTKLGLEELLDFKVSEVVGASLHAQSTFKAPSAVTVVTGAEIRAHGYHTLLEILQSVTGMYATYDRNYGHIGVRGFFVPGDYNSRVLLLVDGHRVNDAFFGGYGLNYDAPVDPDLIEKVEIIRGPGSALYGSNALFAVINVINKRGSDVRGYEASVEGGTHGSYLARATVGGANADGDQWLFAARGYDSDGGSLFYDDFASTPSGGRTSGTDYERAYSFNSQFDTTTLSFDASYTWREKGIPTGAYNTVFDDPDNRTIDAMGYADLTWRPDIGAGRTALLRTYFNDYRYDGWYVGDATSSGGPPDLLYRDRVVGETLGLDTQFSFDHTLGGLLTVGTDTRWNLKQDEKGWDGLNGVYYDDHKDNFELGAFAQDEIALSEHTTFVAGGRVDHYQSFGAEFSPRAAVVYAPDDRSAYKLLYGEAFRAPNASEIYYNVGAVAQVPDLKPETLRNIEAVVEHVYDDGWRVSGSLFHYDVDDLIVRVRDPITSELLYRNVDSVRGNGVELELEKRFAGERRVSVSQAFQDVENRNTGARAVNSPWSVSQIEAESPLFTPNLLAGVEVIVVGPRETLAGDTVGAYALTNLTLRAPHIANGVELALIARNIFDKTYYDPVGPEIVQDSIEQDGFSLALRLTVRR